MLRIRFILIRLRIRPKIPNFFIIFFPLITQKWFITIWILKIWIQTKKKLNYDFFYVFKMKKLWNFCNIFFSLTLKQIRIRKSKMKRIRIRNTAWYTFLGLVRDLQLQNTRPTSKKFTPSLLSKASGENIEMLFYSSGFLCWVWVQQVIAVKGIKNDKNINEYLVFLKLRVRTTVLDSRAKWKIKI